MYRLESFPGAAEAAMGSLDPVISAARAGEKKSAHAARIFGHAV
jgi:hypothetical protein